jgi:hypothetical protein
MENQMDGFIKWLESDLTHFVTLVEEGSTVTGDPIQEGFSDHDITIVVSGDIGNEMRAVYFWLEKNPFDNTYLFGPRLADEFLIGDTLNDLSLKFRSKAIAGKDLVTEKKVPDKESAIQIGTEGLKGLRIRCERRWLNLSHWSEDYSQKKNYELFKNFFVLSAAKFYGQNGVYPTRRVDVVECFTQKELAKDVLNVVNNIGLSTKQDQKIAFESIIKIIDFETKDFN